jgi:hypothetical protein
MNRRLVLLSLTAAALAGYGIWLDDSFGRISGLFDPVGDAIMAEAAVSPAEPPPAPVAKETAALNPLHGLALSSLAAIVERPLFNPGRTPRPAAVAVVETPAPIEEVEAPPPEDTGPNEGDFTLLAIASGPESRVAAVKLTATNEVVFLKQGQPVLNWEVLEVGDREISIGGKDKSIRLSLFNKPALPPPAIQQEGEAPPMDSSPE